MSSQLRVTEDDLPAFFACLALGTLYAIKMGALPPEAGIWTIGSPDTWKPLIKRRNFPKEILGVLQTGDELSAYQELRPHDPDALTDDLIERLLTQIAKIADPLWKIRWSPEQDDPASEH